MDPSCETLIFNTSKRPLRGDAQGFVMAPHAGGFFLLPTKRGLVWPFVAKKNQENLIGPLQASLLMKMALVTDILKKK